MIKWEVICWLITMFFVLNFKNLSIINMHYSSSYYLFIFAAFKNTIRTRLRKTQCIVHRKSSANDELNNNLVYHKINGCIWILLTSKNLSTGAITSSGLGRVNDVISAASMKADNGCCSRHSRRFSKIDFREVYKVYRDKPRDPLLFLWQSEMRPLCCSYAGT